MTCGRTLMNGILLARTERVYVKLAEAVEILTMLRVRPRDSELLHDGAVCSRSVQLREGC